jgi:hypothetical protein
VANVHDDTAWKARSIADEALKRGVGTSLTVSGENLSALISWRTSDVTMGGLGALLASGRLSDIENPEIRRALAAWPAQVADAQEDENLARDFVETVLVPGLLGSGVLSPAYRSRFYPGQQEHERLVFETIEIEVTEELIELATVRSVHALMARGSVRELEHQIDKLILQIDTEIGASMDGP